MTSNSNEILQRPSTVNDSYHTCINSSILRVAFTGHRPAYVLGRSPAELARCRPEINRVLQAFLAQAMTEGKRLEFACSAASGSDIEALEVAEKLGIRVHIVLPLTMEDFAKDFVGLHSPYWLRAERLIIQSTLDNNDWELTVLSGTERPSCYAQCNKELLHRTDAVIALWNEQPSDNSGSIAQMVLTAKRLGIDVIVVNPVNVSN